VRSSAFKYKNVFNIKQSKYCNKRIDYNGKKFDSTKEKNRYIQLQTMLKYGQIAGFQTQVTFELIPKNKHFRAVSYRCDFVISYPDGHKEIEDVKGFRTKDYIIKKKLMWHIHNILIKEI